MLTPYGEKFSGEDILPQYPRPQLIRDSYLNLNGPWDYAFTAGEEPAQYDGQILVPFPPESPLSGVEKGFGSGRGAVVPPRLSSAGGVSPGSGAASLRRGRPGGRGFLQRPASPHPRRGIHRFLGGYYGASDGRGRGKHPDGTGTGSPDLRSLFLRRTEALYCLERYLADSLVRECAGRICVLPSYCSPARGKCPGGHGKSRGERRRGRCLHGDGGTAWNTLWAAGQAGRIPTDGLELWSPETPRLYGMQVSLGKDLVHSYFALRSLTLRRDSQGHRRFFLNGSPIFFNGVLYQGLWPDGLSTPPTDEALLRDVKAVKAMGFNAIRLRDKVECPRFYWHCDRLGVMVLQGLPAAAGRGCRPCPVSGITATLFSDARMRTAGTSSSGSFGKRRSSL